MELKAKDDIDKFIVVFVFVFTCDISHLDAAVS